MSKNIILLFINFLGISVFAQNSLEINLNVSDNAGNKTILNFGLHPSATDAEDPGIDLPAPPFPVTGIFDARFIGNDIGLNLDQGLYKDYRQGNNEFYGQRIHEIQYQVGSGGSNINIEWNFSPGITGRLQDVVLVTIIDVPMRGRGNYVVSNPSVFNKLKMTISYFLCALETPTLAEPPNNSVDINQKPVLSWEASQYAETYLLQVSRNENFDQLVFFDSTITSTSKEIESLSPYLRYYWRVKAKNLNASNPYSAWSQVWNFRTKIIPPVSPTLIFPQDNTFDQELSIIFQWHTTLYAFSYKLELSRDSLFTSLVFSDSMITEPQISISGLEPYTEYFWKVRAKNDAGVSNYSNTSSFITKLIPAFNQFYWYNYFF